MFALSGEDDQDREDDRADVCAVEQFDLLFDTCAARSVCPRGFAPEVHTEPTPDTKLYQADGTKVDHFGSKKVTMYTAAGGGDLTVNFDEKG